MDKPQLKHTFNKRKKLEQDLEHVTQEMYRRNFELAEINRTLSLLRTIDSFVLESQNTLAILSKQITDAIVEDSDYPLSSSSQRYASARSGANGLERAKTSAKA